MSFDPVSYAMGAKAGGGGGGNPNYVETITGTLENPWGEIDVSNLVNEIATNNANAEISWDGTAIGFGTDYAPLYIDNDGTHLLLRTSRIGSPTDYAAIDVNWRASDGGLNHATALTSGAGYIDVEEYASLVTTVLTIIHHPLPEEG